MGIILQITGDADGTWDLTWQDPDFPPEQHYHVDSQDLVVTGKDVRSALQALVDNARDDQPLGPALKYLARAGAELQKAIFKTSGAADLAAARYVRKEYFESQNDWTLLISLSQKVYIPWGLAYSGDPETLPDNPTKDQITPELYGGFWCLKYKVCTLHEIIDSSGVRKPRSFDEVQMLTIVNQGAWETARGRIPPAEIPLFSSSLARSDPPIGSSDEFFRTYRKRYRGIDLLYVYCHASGTKLALSGVDEISVTKFGLNLYFDDREPSPPCLVFLNGCQTAVGAEQGGFMRATGGPGFCGFIGTEAKVPDLFAIRFGTWFFHYLLYKEKSVVEVMDILRRKHFPLSLVYSTCCHPQFKIRRIAIVPPVVPESNLSYEKPQVERQL